MLKTNVGVIDRALRVVIGLALIAFALGFVAPGSANHALGWIGVIPLLTGVFATCPLYSVLGLSTCPLAAR